MSLISEIKTKIRTNLNDLGVVFYSTDDLQDSIQDAVDDIAAQSGCIVKNITLDWEAYLSYYDFAARGVPDFIATLGIFNNVNNRWLFDDLTIDQLNLMDDSWEISSGTPENWIATNFRYTAVFPRYSTNAGTFTLYYLAAAPVALDTSVPLVALDAEALIENYSTADLLEQGEEFTKASIYWNDYMTGIEEYKERSNNNAKRDLLLRF